MLARTAEDTLTHLRTIYTSVDSSSLQSLHKLYHFALKKLILDENSLTFLNSEDRLCLMKFDNGLSTTKADSVGYPLSPFYSSIANILALLTLHGTCSILKFPKCQTSNEHENSMYRVDRLQRIVDLVTSIPAMLSQWTCERFLCRMEMVLETIGRRGMIDLLKMRKTTASRWFMFPLTREEIICSAEKIFSPPSKLTLVGFSVDRLGVSDSTKEFWGDLTGTGEEKNRKGMMLLQRILNEAVWINIHGLYDDQPYLEVRNGQGYGFHCLINSLSFCEFLDPNYAYGWMK